MLASCPLPCCLGPSEKQPADHKLIVLGAAEAEFSMSKTDPAQD